MFGSLLVALGLATCTVAGGHCDSPSTQLVRDEQPVRQPSVTVSDDLDQPQETQDRNDGRAEPR